MPSSHKHQEYVGMNAEKVTVVHPVAERGHGLATTKAAFAGDLLLMSPPLSFVWEGSHSTVRCRILAD